MTRIVVISLLIALVAGLAACAGDKQPFYNRAAEEKQIEYISSCVDQIKTQMKSGTKIRAVWASYDCVDTARWDVS